MFPNLSSASPSTLQLHREFTVLMFSNLGGALETSLIKTFYIRGSNSHRIWRGKGGTDSNWSLRVKVTFKQDTIDALESYDSNVKYFNLTDSNAPSRLSL